ncbi:hypothetical protein [Citricoccus muralis]|uniref:Uncharacterized protein n=1 Tax=Citricoccus muralis TaxID=169134 RepID=A0A3D9LB08_9MICC|nr:hypothetical protein [Citricoccus muralis]REE03569.1 hypothetical protein C8E99_1382 [Citricoccus muralis]
MTIDLSHHLSRPISHRLSQGLSAADLTAAVSRSAAPASHHPTALPAVVRAIVPAPRATERDLWALAAGVAFAAVLLSPVRHYFNGKDKNEEDSFPLSTYPMFSDDRKDRTRIPHVAGFTADGDRMVPHYSHFGAGGLNQVRKQITRMVRQGRAVEVAQRYADALAEQQRRTAGQGTSPAAQRRRKEAGIVRVEIVRSRYFFDTYFAGNTTPQMETVHARADVGGTATAVSETRHDDAQDAQGPPTGPMARSELGNVPPRPIGTGNTAGDYVTENTVQTATPTATETEATP